MGSTVAFILLLLSGIFNGSTTVPVKYARKSQWENLWLIQSVTGMLVLPWVLVLVTVPQLMHVYREAGTRALLTTCLFGLGWGLGGVFFIWGIVLVGMSIGFAVVLSLTATLGSLVPLALLTPTEVHTRRGHFLIFALAITVVGIVLCAIAGAEQNTDRSRVTKTSSVFWRGLLICMLSGLFSPMLNFSFAFGEKILVTAQRFGASELWSTNAVWALTFSAAFIINALYCVWHIGGMPTALAHFRKAPVENLTGGSLMGILQMASIFLYGVGAQVLGKAGTTIGWAITMCTTVLAANVWGMVTGEWHSLSRRNMSVLVAGLGCMVIAIILASQQ